MLKKSQFFEWQIEFDKDVTAQAYIGLSISCKCGYCQNFLIACQNLPVEYFRFLSQLGIDPMKPAEIVEYAKNPDGTHFYGWWYHVTGQITQDSNAQYFMLTPDVQVTIKSKTDLVDENFPRPVIQIDFFSNLSWVLDEKT